jgi:hypothetical protein
MGARLLVLVDERLCVALLLSLGEVIEHWMLLDDESGLVAVEHGDTQLAFALLLSSAVGTGASPRTAASCIRMRWNSWPGR